MTEEKADPFQAGRRREVSNQETRRAPWLKTERKRRPQRTKISVGTGVRNHCTFWGRKKERGTASTTVQKGNAIQEPAKPGW